MRAPLRVKPATPGITRIDLAYVQLASSENARDVNRDIVLEIIRSRQPIARADLARASGLQPSTISAIVEQLLQEKWVTEGAVARRPRGRRPTLLSLNTDLVILAADVRPQQAIVALIDLNGRFLAPGSGPPGFRSQAGDPENRRLHGIHARQAPRPLLRRSRSQHAGQGRPGVPAPHPCPQSQVGQLRREKRSRGKDATASGVSQRSQRQPALRVVVRKTGWGA